MHIESESETNNWKTDLSVVDLIKVAISGLSEQPGLRVKTTLMNHVGQIIK